MIMMIWRRCVCLLALCLYTALLQAAGTVTVTTAPVAGNIVRYSVAWTSTAGGVVSGNGFAVVAGSLISIRFVPGATTPTDLYDVTLVDSDGTVTSADLLSGVGANQSATTSGVFYFDPPKFTDGTRTLDVVVANAGASKTGSVVILVRRP